MTRYRMLLAATWIGVTLGAVLVAWLAVSSAVANVADPTPPVISGPRNHEPSSAPPTSSASAPDAPATASDANELAPVPPANAQDVPSGPTPAAAPTSETGVGDPFVADRQDDPPPTSTPTTNTASFANEGGVVTLSCSGDSVSLVSATPRQGYSVSVGSVGPDEVEVVFTSASRDVEFHGQCVAGKPVADVSGD